MESLLFMTPTCSVLHLYFSDLYVDILQVPLLHVYRKI